MEHEPQPSNDPGVSAVLKFLNYGLSLPERLLRSGVGVAAGAVRESTELLVPRAFRSAKSYQVFVQQMLDFLWHDVGGVKQSDAEQASPTVQHFVARKSVGNFLEMASLCTLHVSPIMLLAAISDIAYGSQVYLKELATELKARGIIDEKSTIDRMDDLLIAVAATSGDAASAFDMPPLSTEGMKEAIAGIRQSAKEVDPKSILPEAELHRLWSDMREVADREHVGLLDVSAGVTMVTLKRIGRVGEGTLLSVRAAGTLFDRYVIKHYTEAIHEVRSRGLFASVSEAAEPYLEAVWNNFSREKETVTQQLLSGKLAGSAWRSVRRWLGREGKEPAEVARSAAESEAAEPTAENPLAMDVPPPSCDVDYPTTLPPKM